MSTEGRCRQQVLSWKDLTFTVGHGKGGGGKKIIDGVSGRAEPGQVLGIMGPSGCGKTSLLDLLADR